METPTPCSTKIAERAEKHFEHYACLASANLINENQASLTHKDNLLDTLVAIDSSYLKYESRLTK